MKDFLFHLAVTIDAEDNGVPTLTDQEIITNILNTFYFVAGAAAVIVLIIAGFNYVLSGGDSGKVSRAKNMILYAIIGLIVIVSAYAITNFVIGAFS